MPHTDLTRLSESAIIVVFVISHRMECGRRSDGAPFRRGLEAYLGPFPSIDKLTAANSSFAQAQDGQSTQKAQYLLTDYPQFQENGCCVFIKAAGEKNKANT